MRLHGRRRSCKWVLILLPVFVVAIIIRSYSHHQTNTPSHTAQTNAAQNTAHVLVLQSGRPPRVDRSILDKLRSLDADGCLTEASTRRSWPPKVTRLPVEASQSLRRDSVLDNELCKTTPCRLLLPTFIGEQESKARRHLLQLSHLAQILNRTLVLPNVGRSRMGTCSKWDFGYYYELAESHNAQVSFGAFRRWVALRGMRPRAQVIEVLPALRDTVDVRGLLTFNASDLPDLENAEVAISTSCDPANMSHNHCLRGRASNLHFGDFSPVYIYPRASASVRYSSGRGDGLFNFGRGMVAALSSPVVAMESKRFNDTKSREPDVLLFNWEIRHPVFPLVSDEGLPYAAQWTKVAESLSTRLQPLIAVHWRMEQVPISSLLSCAPLLVSSIISLLQVAKGIEITSVYLATDYPTEGLDKPHSSTFHVSKEHHAVMRLFETAFAEAQELSSVKLTNLVSELRFEGLVPKGFDVGDLDPGLMGIIDKMVSARAMWFISGGPVCGRKR